MADDGHSYAQSADRRIWLAVALGTMLVTISFWSLVYAFVSAAADHSTEATTRSLAAGALGMALVPLVFATVAFVSGHPAAPLATIKAMALALVVGVPALAILQDLVTGLVVGFGAGALAALRPRLDPRVGHRSMAVIATGLVSLVLAAVAAPLALALGPSLPLVGVALADHLAPRTEGPPLATHR